MIPGVACQINTTETAADTHQERDQRAHKQFENPVGNQMISRPDVGSGLFVYFRFCKVDFFQIELLHNWRTPLALTRFQVKQVRLVTDFAPGRQAFFADD